MKKILEILLNVMLAAHGKLYKAIGLIATKVEGEHPKHRLTKYHNFFLKNITPNDKVLDVGCGDGILTVDLARKAKQVVGIDINPRNIKQAKKEHQKDNIRYILADATKMNFKEKFDVIVLSNVLEHIKDRVVFLRKMGEVGMKILVRVPMLERDWLTIYKKERGVDYKLDKTHFIEYTLDEFISEVRKAGLKLENYYIKFGEIHAVLTK